MKESNAALRLWNLEKERRRITEAKWGLKVNCLVPVNIRSFHFIFHRVSMWGQEFGHLISESWWWIGSKYNLHNQKKKRRFSLRFTNIDWVFSGYLSFYITQLIAVMGIGLQIRRSIGNWRSRETMFISILQDWDYKEVRFWGEIVVAFFLASSRGCRSWFFWCELRRRREGTSKNGSRRRTIYYTQKIDTSWLSAEAPLCRSRRISFAYNLSFSLLPACHWPIVSRGAQYFSTATATQPQWACYYFSKGISDWWLHNSLKLSCDQVEGMAESDAIKDTCALSASLHFWQCTTTRTSESLHPVIDHPQRFHVPVCSSRNIVKCSKNGRDWYTENRGLVFSWGMMDQTEWDKKLSLS